jgi:hypothetical protein
MVQQRVREGAEAVGGTGGAASGLRTRAAVGHFVERVACTARRPRTPKTTSWCSEIRAEEAMR